MLFDTYAFTIDLVPLVLEKTCFVGHITEDIAVLPQVIQIYKYILHKSKWWKSYKL